MSLRASGGGQGLQLGAPAAVLTGAAASIDFTDIPQTGRALIITATLRGDSVAEQIATLLQLNGDATAVYNSEVAQAAAAALSSSEGLSGTSARIANAVAASALANMFGGLVAFIPDYATTDRFKTVMSLGGSPVTNATTKTVLHWTFAVWRNTAAINRVTILPGAGNFIAGSRAAVYLL